MNKVVFGLISFVCVVSLIGNYLLYQRYSSSHPLIGVNNQVIRRKDLDDQLDYLYSRSVLRRMIIEQVVAQAAAQQHVTPSDADVATEITWLKRVNPQAIDQAQVLDPKLVVFKEQVRTQLAVRNLRTQGVMVSNSEVADYYHQHQQDFRLPPQVKGDVALAEDSIAAQAAAQLFRNNDSPDVVAEQNGVKVLGVNTAPMKTLPPGIEQAMMKMKAGEVRSFPAGSLQYLVVHVTQASPTNIPPLASIWPQVEIAAKLAKGPTTQDEMERLMSAAHIDVQTSKYADAVPNFAPAAAQ